MTTFRQMSAKTLASWAVLACACLPAPAGAVGPGLADSIARMVPDGPVTVDILTPQYSFKVEDIASRIDAARRANPRFFQGWIAQHPGGPPPWNPALGVTRPEYDLYLREGRSAAFTVRSRARLTFQRDGRARRWTLHGWGLLTPLEGMVIDADRGVVRTIRSGPLPLIGTSAPTDTEVQLKWRWYAVWRARHVVGDPRKGGQALQASLHIGPLGAGDTTGMYWVMRRFNGGKKLADEFLLLRFPARR